MTTEDTPVAGETQIEGMMQTFENSMRLLGQKVDTLKDDTLSAFNEVHQTVDMAKERNNAVRAANARFRAFLGFSNNPPPELQQIEDKTE